MTCPSQRHVEAALAMVESHLDWIAARVAELPAAPSLDIGSVVPVLGRPTPIMEDPGRRRRAHRRGGALYVSGSTPAERCRRVETVLRQEFLEASYELVARAAAQLGDAPAQVRVRDMRTRWGSCTASRRLTFNWRLVFAPSPVVWYVVCHEVAHLRHMNHSPAFWRVVEELCPEYRDHEAWLKSSGTALLAFGQNTSNAAA